MSFWKELSRRNVVKVGIAYAVAAWLIIHPVDIIFPILHLPEWSITLVAAFLIILFPLVLIFAWAYEITPKGLKKTKEVPVSKSITHLTGKRLNYIIVGLLVIAVAYLLFDKYYINRHATETVQVPAISTAIMTKKSVVVIPFANLSSDKEQESFVDGLSEELINTIAQIPNLRVIARTSSFAFKDSDKTAQAIAKELNVEYILEGSVRKAGNELRITAQLIRAADESHLWSKPYDKELKDIFAIQEDIATSVANELKITLGIGRSLKQLGGTDNEKAYELYLIAKGRYRGGPTTVSLARKPIDEAIALDPEFALAWALRSYIYSRLPLSESQKVALKSAQKAVGLEPKLAEAYASLGYMNSELGKWIEAELAFRNARELITEPSLSYEIEYPMFYEYVGNLKKAQKIFEGLLTNDPLNGNYCQNYIFFLGYLGDINKIEEEYKNGRELHGDQWAMNYNVIWNLSLARLGTGHALSRDDLPYSTPIFNAAKEHLSSPKEALERLHQFNTNTNKLSYEDYMDIYCCAAYFGDPEFAMDTIEKSFNVYIGTIGDVWLPVMKDVRKLPRFKAFVKKIGLVDYWNKFGWPDICHKLDNGDFVCD
jgi:adenylate cyclase